MGANNYPTLLQSCKLELLLNKLGMDTKQVYAAAWKQWAWFLRARKMCPFLVGEAWLERVADEKILWLLWSICLIGSTAPRALSVESFCPFDTITL